MQVDTEKTTEITVTPTKNFDVGAGKGKAVVVKRFDHSKGNRNQTTNLVDGLVGLIIDTRGRPMVLPSDDSARIAKLREWLGALSLPLP